MQRRTSIPSNGEENNERFIQSQTDGATKTENEIRSTTLNNDMWKELAKEVFCNTTGDSTIKITAVVEALKDLDDKVSWLGFTTESDNEYLYDQDDHDHWDALNEHNLCGDWDLLVWGSVDDGPCEIKYPGQITHDAHLLQTSCMQENSGDLVGALNCMLQRESLYDLWHDFIIVYFKGAQYFWLWNECFNEEYQEGLPVMYSFWTGDSR